MSNHESKVDNMTKCELIHYIKSLEKEIHDLKERIKVLTSVSIVDSGIITEIDLSENSFKISFEEGYYTENHEYHISRLEKECDTSLFIGAKMLSIFTSDVFKGGYDGYFRTYVCETDKGKFEFTYHYYPNF